MTSTEKLIGTLESLKSGDLGQLRMHAGQPLDQSVDGFDLFTGLWWPLRAKDQRAPRREVAWLVAKLYAFCPIPHSRQARLAAQLGKLKSPDEGAAERRQRRFDELLTLPLSQIEPALQWAVGLIAKNAAGLDWVRMTDDLSIWEREKTRVDWAEQYLRLVP